MDSTLLLKSNKLRFNSELRQEIRNPKITSQLREEFRVKARENVYRIVEYLFKLNILPEFLFLVKSLMPKRVQNPENKPKIIQLARILNFDVSLVHLEDELLQLSLEDFQDEEEDVFKFYENLSKINYTGDGSPKYKTLLTLFHISVVVSPSNAEVERGFSESLFILTKSRNRMSEITFNSKKNIKAHLKTIDGIQNFEFNDTILQKAVTSNSAYNLELEEEKKKTQQSDSMKEVKLTAEKAKKTIQTLSLEVEAIEKEIPPPWMDILNSLDDCVLGQYFILLIRFSLKISLVF